MSDTSTLGYPDAARRLGVPVRVLRRAIRSGALPAPTAPGATAILSAEWLAAATAATEAPGHALRKAAKQAVPPFARFRGTSAWHQYGRRAREYARFRALPA